MTPSLSLVDPLAQAAQLVLSMVRPQPGAETAAATTKPPSLSTVMQDVLLVPGQVVLAAFWNCLHDMKNSTGTTSGWQSLPLCRRT